MNYGEKFLVSVIAGVVTLALMFLVVNWASQDIEDSSDTYTVSRVIDGDTLELSDGSVIRLAGIDTPERGDCGFEEARMTLEAMVLDKPVRLVEAGGNDTDRYDRLIRYVEVGDRDAGRSLIDEGLAHARYDSRDGYGEHDREAEYVAADVNSKPDLCSTP